MLWLVFYPVFGVEQPAEYSHMLPVTRLEDGTKSGTILFNLFFTRPLLDRLYGSASYGLRQGVGFLLHDLDPFMNFFQVPGTLGEFDGTGEKVHDVKGGQPIGKIPGRI